MNKQFQAQNPSGRTPKRGLLSNMEREYLEGNREYTQKQKATLLKSLLPRIDAISSDIKLIFDSENTSIEKWLADNWSELYTFGERTKLRHYSKLEHYRPGHIKIRSRKNNEKTKTPLYWLDMSERKHLSYNDLPWPDHWTRKIRNKNVKQILKRAFVLEEEVLFSKLPSSQTGIKSIIPVNKNDAISIKEIQKRIRIFENKLK